MSMNIIHLHESKEVEHLDSDVGSNTHQVGNSMNVQRFLSPMLGNWRETQESTGSLKMKLHQYWLVARTAYNL
jgi:hypothetical protein